MKTIRELVNGLDSVEVEYRTFTPDGQDMFTGMAEYKNGQLYSLDGDNYSLDDQVSRWEYGNNILTVWYESRWISG